MDVSGPVDIKQLLLFTFIFLAGFGAVFGIGLAFAAQKFAVKVDPKVEMVRDVLPGQTAAPAVLRVVRVTRRQSQRIPDISPSLCSPGKGPCCRGDSADYRKGCRRS